MPVKLLSTDFDGTLVQIFPQPEGSCPPELADQLIAHREAGGSWAVNTGRTLHHTLEGLEIFEGPHMPDFLISIEREVYEPDGTGHWQPLGEWNEVCDRRHRELFDSSDDLFAAIREISDSSQDVTLIHEGEHPAGIVTTDNRVMDRVIAEIFDNQWIHPDFSCQRNSVYLRFCHRDYHKGSALGYLGEKLGISREDILAAGDNHNDLSMLNGRYAAMTCCPANAIPEVKNSVRATKGFLSEKTAGIGVAEGIAHWRAIGSLPD